MVQSGTATRRRTRLLRIVAFIAAAVLARVVITSLGSSTRPESGKSGAGHGSSLQDKPDVISNGKSKWAPIAASLSKVVDTTDSDAQQATLGRDDATSSAKSKSVGHESASLSVSVPPKTTTLNRFKTGGATPGVWHSAEAHEGVMKAIGYALIERYPDHLDTNKLVMVTVANEAFQELLMNWLAFTRARDVPVLVGALDDATFERCGAMSVPAVQLQHAGFDTTLVSLDEHSVKNKDFRSSQRGFQNYGVRKLAFLLTLLELGLDVSLSDTDVVWQKSPVDLFSGKSGTYTDAADVLVTSDCLSQDIDSKMTSASALTLTSSEDAAFNYKEWACGIGGPEPWEDNASPLTSRINTGVTFFRSTEGGLAMAKRWIGLLVRCFDGDNPGCDDQTSFNSGAQPGGRSPVMNKDHETKPVKGGEGRVYWSEFDGKRCALGYLPISDFSNGHVFFLQKVPQNLEKHPYAIHNTHNFYGAAGKLYRFRASQLWAIEGNLEEYSAELNYLSFESFAGHEASKESSPLVAHILARDELRREIWAAIGLAKVLDRVLVLPRFNCFCDRYWYPILPQCRLPGSQRFAFSQSCPLDQILDVGAVAADGFVVKTRVDGFFDNAKAKPLLGSRKEVSLVETRENVQCLSPEQIKQTLGTSETVLHIAGGVKGVFCGFPDDSVEAKALDDGISKAFNSDWCCHQNGSMPIAPHARVSALPAGSADAGPRADEVSVKLAVKVWDLTVPEKDKWQALLFGKQFPEGSGMTEHNHYKC